MSNDKPNQNLLTHNWLYKLAAVLSAVVIWAFVTVTLNPLTDAYYTVAVEMRGLAENLTMDNTSYQVNVRVNGSAADINSLRSADIEAYADFTGLLANEVTVEVMVDVPPNVTLVSQNLKSITVVLKQKRSEMFPLSVEIMGEPATNYKTLPPVISPAEVRLRGTDDYIRKVGRVYVTASIQDVEGEGFEKDLSIVVEDNAGNDISTMFSIEPRVAKVVIPTVFDQPEKTVAVHVPITGDPALGYQVSLISVTPSTVRVFGDINRLQALDYVETVPLDITDIRFDDSFTLNLALGNGFAADRSSVTVALKIEPVNYLTFTKTLLLAHNLGEGLAADVQQQELSIMIYGPETFIATLDEAEIVPYVDCADLPEGEYTLPIRVSLPTNVTLLDISVDMAEVNIYSSVLDGEVPLEEEPPDIEDSVPVEGDAEDRIVEGL